jgi:hypothetical protein
MKDWKVYCETSFNGLGANLHNWGNPKYTRPITRIYYFGVFDSGNPNPTGLISENALYNKLSGKKTVLDHCLSPQFICRMILDNPDTYLINYKEFERMFWLSCQTIVVTQQENEQLSTLTTNDDSGYKVAIATHLKYNHLGINLLKREEGKKRWKDSVMMNSNVIDAPKELLQYEQRFLIGA